MRLTNKRELQVLIDKGLVNGASKAAAQAFIQSNIKSKRKMPRSENGRVCALIPGSPALVLYQKLVNVYGRHYSSGLLVLELCFRPLGRNWRLDMAIPFFKLGIELDGWKAHGLYRDSFLRDREKSLWFERRGWRIIRFSANQVMHEIDDVLLAVSQIMGFCNVNTDKDWFVKPLAIDRSEYNHE